VSRGRQSDQANRKPQVVRLHREQDRHHAQRAHQHCAFACAVDAPAVLDETAREPATADAANIGEHEDHDQRQAESQQCQSVFGVQELWQPEEEEPPDRIGDEFRGDERPGLAMAQNPRPRHAHCRFRRIAADMRKFRG
jgi:hypothetical protein